MTKHITIALRDDQARRLSEFAEHAGTTPDQLVAEMIDELLPQTPTFPYTPPTGPYSSIDIIGSLTNVEPVESNEEIDRLIADEAAGAHNP